MSETTAVTTPLTVWVSAFGGSVTAILVGGWPWWLWTPLLLWLLFVLIALLGQGDAASRRYIAGTLRKSTFTQIYTVLAKRLVTGVWARLCDPVADDALPRSVFRAALTWRLYDRALLIAVAYPILLPVLWWLGSGQDATIGAAVLLEGTGLWDFWPERVAILGAFVILTTGLVAYAKAAASQRRTVRKQAVVWPLLAAASATAVFAFAFEVAFAGAFVFAVAFVFALAFVSAFGYAVGFASAFPGAVAFTGAFASTGAFAFTGAVTSTVVSGVCTAPRFQLDGWKFQGSRLSMRLWGCPRAMASSVALR